MDFWGRQQNDHGFQWTEQNAKSENNLFFQGLSFNFPADIPYGLSLSFGRK
jgi:hypothetical protein